MWFCRVKALIPGVYGVDPAKPLCIYFASNLSPFRLQRAALARELTSAQARLKARPTLKQPRLTFEASRGRWKNIS